MQIAVALPSPPSPIPQAQTFCPQFHFRQTLPLTLDARTLAEIAASEARVELYHQAPRSQAVAAALAGSRPAAAAAGGPGAPAVQQSVLLGAASLPLAPLLTRPQVGNGYQAMRPLLAFLRLRCAVVMALLGVGQPLGALHPPASPHRVLTSRNPL